MTDTDLKSPGHYLIDPTIKDRKLIAALNRSWKLVPTPRDVLSVLTASRSPDYRVATCAARAVAVCAVANELFEAVVDDMIRGLSSEVRNNPYVWRDINRIRPEAPQPVAGAEITVRDASDAELERWAASVRKKISINLAELRVARERSKEIRAEQIRRRSLSKETI